MQDDDDNITNIIIGTTNGKDVFFFIGILTGVF